MRPTEWIGAFLNDTATAPLGTTAAISLVSPDDLEEYTHPTLMRTHGMIHVYDSSAASRVAHGFGAFGLIVIDVDPVAAVLPVLDPMNFGDYEWYLHRYWSVTGNGVNGTESVTGFFRVDLDSAAMRRIEKGETLAAYFTHDALSGLAAVNYWFATRFLLKE